MSTASDPNSQTAFEGKTYTTGERENGTSRSSDGLLDGNHAYEIAIWVNTYFNAIRRFLA